MGKRYAILSIICPLIGNPMFPELLLNLQQHIAFLQRFSEPQLRTIGAMIALLLCVLGLFYSWKLKDAQGSVDMQRAGKTLSVIMLIADGIFFTMAYRDIFINVLADLIKTTV